MSLMECLRVVCKWLNSYLFFLSNCLFYIGVDVFEIILLIIILILINWGVESG